MTLEAYLLFVGASFVLVLVPGPDMIFLLARCIAQGRRAGVVAAFGINAGAYVHLIAAVTGLSAVILTSALAFTAVKWLGAGYLIYLGIQALRGRGSGLKATDPALSVKSLRAVFFQGFLSDALNPKVAIFFLALLPQFVNLKAGGVVGQLLLLGLTVNILALLVNLVIVYISATVSEGLRRNSRVGAMLQRAMGVMFIGLGARLVAEKA